jgi:hypothetical protein
MSYSVSRAILLQYITITVYSSILRLQYTGYSPPREREAGEAEAEGSSSAPVREHILFSKRTHSVV